jgi:hypothetical protein
VLKQTGFDFDRFSSEKVGTQAGIIYIVIGSRKSPSSVFVPRASGKDILF